MPNYRYQQGDQPLDGYTIQYALGRGGFGEVYFGISDSGRQVALKAVQNYEDVELRGISHCMNLKSPHLVTIFDVRRGEGGVPWVIMEYVSGPSLHEVLTEAGDAGIGEDQAMFFTRELIKGLRYLHDAGVVHRDLKPHNIFFEDGTVKIGDYSLSKAISGTQQTGHTTTVGSVHYMAPEIGEGKYDKAVDIYALGVILFEMLTGQPPYVGQSMGEVLIKHLTSEPDVSKISQPYADVIRTAMQRDPDKRFESVDQMLQALCPTDHSSYLPPPTSLTMVGERAAKRRAQQNHATSAQHGSNPSQSLTDTFLPTAEMVDTKEAKVGSDSIPFSRPGIPKYSLSWLAFFGMYWKPTGKQLAGTDAVWLIIRIVVAVLASAILLTMTSIMVSTDPIEILLLAPLVVVFAGGITWGMLQFLPRSPILGWMIVSRLCSTILVGYSGALFGAILCTLGYSLPTNHFNDHLLVTLLLAGFIDWRCFISADRYPRVGMFRTATVSAFFAFSVLLGIHQGVREDSLWVPLASLIAAVISIQLLAPHHREVVTQTNTGGKPQKDSASKKQATVAPEITNTKTDELERQVIQKESH